MTETGAARFQALEAYVEGIGLLGPGLSSWEHGCPQIRGDVAYHSARCELPLPAALPPAERRRAGTVVKVSLAVATEAVASSGLAAAGLASVFSSSSGDAVNCHEICSALASTDRLISPTRFHNSVHNASSGYWSISSGSMTTSSVLCARDASFAAGLLEAMTQVYVENKPVLLVAYDTDYPEPLRSVRPLPDTFGVALVLAPGRSARSHARLRIDTGQCFTETDADRMDHPALDDLRRSIPAARCLFLLKAIADRQSMQVAIAYLAGLQLAVQVAP